MTKIIIPREVLLIEIERRCMDSQCNARTLVGLTKDDALLYTGFECERCQRWHADSLSRNEIPEQWRERGNDE